MSTNFKALFKKNREEKASIQSNLMLGDVFPLEKLKEPVDIDNENFMVLFVSFSCRDCIEMLPQLSAFNPFHRQFLIITDGEEAEYRGLIAHFNYSFVATGIPFRDFYPSFGVAITPQAYRIRDGRIDRIGSPHTGEELLALWNGASDPHA
ncbi:hypothetical protein [Paenibacillus sp. MMS18-CY102]|uniref:hypothetical protein n=1 Tax=Paenibacillus sp. MMS18-CY102 TaxID=2682849 RepID=UPI0013655003|nr:hypothetical protein [Paenibacillus sp. MMS18-CY102]MWC31302.1 hypothetical protein [Paenibacillus sp. MMS18-CY102]